MVDHLLRLFITHVGRSFLEVLSVPNHPRCARVWSRELLAVPVTPDAHMGTKCITDYSDSPIPL